MATSRPTDDAATRRFTRWPGLFALAAGLLLGPVAALVNEGLIYVAISWACARGAVLALHAISVICLSVALGAGARARRDWSVVGRGTHDEDYTVGDRSRFLALCGMAASAVSALVIITQWLAIFVFGPCARA